MDQKETSSLVGNMNIFIIYDDSYREDVGENVSSYK